MTATAAAPPAAAGGATPGAPAGPIGPQTMAPQSAGMQMRGRIMVSLATEALDRALAMIGTQSEEGQELATVILKLRKKFGGSRRDLAQQEVKMMGESVPGVSQPNPAQGQALAQMIRSRQAGMGMGGPPPSAGAAGG